MKYDLTFTNASGQRETLTVRGSRCVAEWHAAKLLRQRVARAITIAPNSPSALTAALDRMGMRLLRSETLGSLD